MRKPTPLQIIRRITQLLALICFTGTFALAFSGFEALVTSLANRQFSWPALGMFLAPLGLVIVLNLFFGRIFCGWFCAFGAFNDLLYSISQRLLKNKLKVTPRLDGILKYLKYGILIFLAVFVWTLNLVPVGNLNPWTPFAQLGEVFKGGLAWSLGLFILGLVALGAFLIERFFCRYLCPLGAILAPLSKVTLSNIAKPTAECRSCKLCSKACPMGINLSSTEAVNSPECIRCLECVTVCPRQNPQLKLLSGKMNGFVYTGLAILVFGAISCSGPFLVSLLPTNANTVDSTVKGTNLNASAVDSGDTSNQPENTADQPVPEAPQPNEVTASSGTAAKTGTASVQAAFKSAQPAATPGPATKAAVSQQRYKDGVYSGTATGFRPGLNVAVTLKKDRITQIEIRETSDDRPFLDRASQSVIADIIATQSTDVDAVSGATYSSRGIMDAVKDALSKAK